MSRSLVTGVVAVGLTLLGFVAGATGDAFRWRESRTEPWRKILVEHEGAKGAATRTRIIFQNPELPLQAIEVQRDAEEKPEVARVTLKDGTELGVRYDQDGHPSKLEAPDGTHAELAYGQTGTRVTLFAADGSQAGTKVVHPSAALRAPLGLAVAEPESEASPVRTAVGRLEGLLVGEAWAQAPSEAQAEDEAITVRRDVAVQLDVRLPGGKDVGPGPARIEASCAPFTCLPATPDLPTPSNDDVRIVVSGSALRSKLGGDPAEAALEPFVTTAKSERKQARRVLPDVSAVVAAVGIVSLGCRSLGAEAAVCVKGLGKTGAIASAAVAAVSAHGVETEGAVVEARARTLYFEERARAALDQPTHLELCLSRDKYARACTTIDGRPFASEPMARESRAVDLKKRIGATLAGKYVVVQGDGPDCKFSPSPRTAGPLQVGIDSERGTVTASFRADDHGTRPDMRCSLGAANMSWSQTYSVTATQSFTPAQLQAGGKLAVRLTGTMTGSGTFSFSNCRTPGGSSAGCPGGKSEPYGYPVELVGEIDLDSGKGGGNIVVRNAPLSTSGTWTTEGEK